MIYKTVFAACLAVFLFISTTSAQKADVTISLNEAFFDVLLDSVFQNFDPPQFSIAQNNFSRRDAATRSLVSQNSKVKSKNEAEVLPFYFSPFTSSESQLLSGKTPACEQSIKILKEMNGVRTAVRFREGKIYVPLAFSGDYALPLVGCVAFAGWAETNIDIEFDKDAQRLVGRARVLNVNLNGTGGVGGTMIAKLLQSTIDKKLNPIEILKMDKLTFGVPVQNSGSLKMKAVAVRPEIVGGALNIAITYQFSKS